MKIEQLVWNSQSGWQKKGRSFNDNGPIYPSVIIIFGQTDVLLNKKECLDELRQRFPDVPIMGCSSGANIIGDNIVENTILATLIELETSQVKIAKIHIEDVSESYQAGIKLFKEFPIEHLRHIFLLTDALKIDGTKLVEGMVENLPANVALTGGLASDGDRLQHTPIYYNGEVEEGSAVAIGFYGERLNIGFACEAGWIPYGPERIATKAKDNVLYELDGQPALALYKELLGSFADRLPSVGLLYPLSVRINQEDKPLARTIVAVNEADQSITLAGGIPVGSYTQFMMTNVTKLINGAEISANQAIQSSKPHPPTVAFLLSCYARKQVMKQRTEEEIEAVRAIFGNDVLFSGYYTYGEISSKVITDKCHLQNQTLAITVLSEI